MPVEIRFPSFAWRVTACHVLSYFLAGMLAFTVMDYRGLFTEPALANFMRPVNSPWVAAGPTLQIMRGLVIAAVLYAFRGVFLDGAKGWLKLYALVIGLSVLSASGPSPSSLEGVVYTQLTPLQHLRGLPELLLQNLLFATALVAWCRRPSKAWNIAMGVALALVVSMSALGALASFGVLKP